MELTKVKKWIGDNPWLATGAACGTGLLIGMLIFRS